MTQKRRVGRPSLSQGEQTVPTMIRLPSSLREAVSTEAERRDVPVGALMREMLEKQIAQEGRTAEVMPEALLAHERIKNEWMEKQVAQECEFDEALFKSLAAGDEVILPAPKWTTHNGQPSPIRWRRS